MEAVEKKKAITEFERKWKKIRQNIEKIEIKEESKCFRKNENNRKWIRKERKTNGMKKEREKKRLMEEPNEKFGIATIIITSCQTFAPFTSVKCLRVKDLF